MTTIGTMPKSNTNNDQDADRHSRTSNIKSARSPSSSTSHIVKPKKDAFLYYSNPINLRRAQKFLPPIEQEDTPQEEVIQGQQEVIVRKTRISFERDPFTIMMEDEDFLALFDEERIEDES